MKEKRDWKFETLQLHVGQEEPDAVSDARAVPIYQTTSYVFRDCAHAAARFNLTDAGNIYGRLTNTTQDIFEQRIAALEGGVAALAVASGAAAITYTFQNLAQAGDHIVAAKTIYGGSYNLLAHTLPEYGITTTFVDPDEEGAFERAIQENTKAIFIETIGNPNANLIDIPKVAEIAHSRRIPLVVDSTFATPYLVRPFELGADIVVHSATKFIGGHGTTIGGVIVDSGNFDWKASGKFPSLTDPNPSYHGVSFVEAAGKAAFVTKIRAILLRDMGATLSPIHAFIFPSRLGNLVPAGGAPCGEYPEGGNILKGSSAGGESRIILLSRIALIILCIRSISQEEGLRSLRLRFRGEPRRLRSLLTICRSFLCWRMWRT